MTQHITQEVAIALAKQAELFSQFGLINGVVTTTVANVRVQELCNAAIQHYLDQRKAELPVLPEWSKQDNLGGLVPSEIRMSMRDFGQQCAAHARKLALDEAMQACKRLEIAIDGGGNTYYRPADARQCVSAIETLKGK